jgi:hypothetical protein
MQQASCDHIMDTHVKALANKGSVKGQLLHQGKWLTRGQIQQKFPHLMGALNAMETIAS